MKNILQFAKKGFTLSALALSLVACGNESGGSNQAGSENTYGGTAQDGKITMVWLPNESAQDSQESREAIGEHIQNQTGLEVEHQLTTDYNVAIEAIANGEADIGYLGGESYIQAHEKNDSVVPLVVASGPSGTIDDALYYSWLAVKEEALPEYQEGDEYSIEPIEGKRMSFVSQSSTSGFAVPTATISEVFGVERDQLVQGGDFFSEVLFGGSHQGSLVNLLTDRADVSAICDTCVVSYVDLAEGEANTAGSIYQIKENAEAPFSNHSGERFGIINAEAVLNEPIAINTDNLDQATVEALIEAFTSEEMNADERIWAPEGSDSNAILEKEGDSQFTPTDDAWYDQMRG